MKISTQEIIRALRCSASVPPADEACRKCAYGIVEKLELEDGNEHEFVSCDTDRIVVAAADRLEELTGGNKYENSEVYC